MPAQRKSRGRTTVEATMHARERYEKRRKVLERLQREETQIGNRDPFHGDLPGLAVAIEAASKDCQAAHETV